MTKQVSEFASAMNTTVDALVKGADVHSATHTAVFKASDLTMPEGVTEESLAKHVKFINETSAAVPAAVAKIAADQYEETKHEKWDGALTLIPGLTFTGGVQLREEVDGNVAYGVTQSLTDYTYDQELTDWMVDHQADLATKAADLFK